MRWRSGRRSGNVEDRRGSRVGRKAAGGGIMGIIIILVAMYFGIDPSMLMNLTGLGGQSGGQVQQQQPVPAGQDKLADFVSVVLADTEDTWREIFRQSGNTYQEPKLVLFTGTVQSACGFAQAASGPFYCPGDKKVYIDLAFYRDLKNRFRAPGDFAQAYVISHEVAHHVQNLLGIAGKVQAQRRRSDKVRANELSVRMELQADCLAGVWANHADRARQILESGDIEEALNAASAIGDDRIQQSSRGYITPDSFTHGSSAQRVRWFKQGLESGQPSRCDTFSSKSL